MYTSADVDRITLQVYRDLLDADYAGAADRMVAEDKDDGQLQAGRSKAFRRVVAATLTVAGLYQPIDRAEIMSRARAARNTAPAE